MVNNLDYKKIGLKVKYYRVKKNITQQSLAESCDISVSHTSNIETGKTKASLETMYKISSVLGCAIDELLRDDAIADKALEYVIFEDCDEYEKAVIKEVVMQLKESLKNNKVSSIKIK